LTKFDQRIHDVSEMDGDQDVPLLLSHDIRSALSQILGASQLLEEFELNEDSAELVERIKTATLYINDLLDTAVDVSETNPITELVPSIWQLGSMWATSVEQKGIEFQMTRKGIIPKSLRMPQLDFLRIFNNIVGNALKFSDEGVLEVRLGRGENAELVIEVLDDGPGFSEEAYATLFSKHGRPKENAVEGSGLGLYIAQSLAQKSGGEIRVENRVSGGARVRVIFPEDLLILATNSDDKIAFPIASAERARPSLKNGLPDLSHLRILLAEDNPTNQLVATQMLKKMNAVVETAADGVEAMALFESGDFNLGLIDIEMPRKSGLEVMREMRARPDSKAETTLLALTAYVLPEHLERITNAGADGIIAKPLTDLAAFGNAILIYTGEADGAGDAELERNLDADIQMDIYDGLKELIGHDSMQELLDKVISDLADVKDGLQKGIQDQDVLPIRANTHILISVAGAIGAVNLQHIAEQLNATAKTGDWACITPDSIRCESGVAAVMKFAENELDR